MRTNHFIKRCKQRGISDEVILLVELFGKESKNILNRSSLHLSKKDVNLIQTDLKRLIRFLDDQKSIQIIESSDGSYITILK